MFYNVNELKRVNINKLIKYYHLGAVGDKFIYCCNHEMDGANHNPSCVVDYDTNVCFCKSGSCSYCNKPMDVLNIVSIMERRPNRGDGFKLNCQKLMEIDKDIAEEFEAVKIKNNVVKKDKEKTEEDTYFKYDKHSINIHQFHYKQDFSLDLYLEKRKIDFYKIEDILNANKIVIKQQLLTNKETGVIEDRICYIFDKNKQFCVGRKTGDYIMKKNYKEERDANGKRICYKFNSSNPTYSYIKTPDKPNKSLLIFEGFWDCLSFMSTCSNRDDYDYISLNSTVYTRTFIDDCKDKLEQYDKIITLLDNDPSGRKSSLTFQKELADYIVVDYSNLYLTFNDVNEYIIKKGELRLYE